MQEDCIAPNLYRQINVQIIININKFTLVRYTARLLESKVGRLCCANHLYKKNYTDKQMFKSLSMF